MKYKISQFAKKNNVTIRTVWNWIKLGKVKTEQTNTGGWLIIEDENSIKDDCCVATYARVSSSENISNLNLQSDRLVSFANAKGYKVVKIIKEVGSGLNDNRPKLYNLLNDDSIKIILVEHKDRFSRFGNNYINLLLEKQGRKLEIINEVNNDNEDIIQDFVSIITSFCARIYGKRRSRRNTEKLIKELNN